MLPIMLPPRGSIPFAVCAHAHDVLASFALSCGHACLPGVHARVTLRFARMAARGCACTRAARPQDQISESTSFQAPVLVNIGGKIMHFALPQVHAPAALASVQRQVNAFGVFFSVFTSASNFHTSSTQTATLFRGGSSRAAVLEAIDRGAAEQRLPNGRRSGPAVS